MSDSVRPHKRQPTGLPHPWDSPGKNTGVGCHFLLQCMKVKSENEVSQSCLTLSDPMDCNPPGSSIHGICQARVLECSAIAFFGSVHYLTPNSTSLSNDGFSPEVVLIRLGSWSNTGDMSVRYLCKVLSLTGLSYFLCSFL